MEAEKLEVFCKNPGCGDPEVHSGYISHHETRKYRRMNYMGKRDISIGRMLASFYISNKYEPSGQLYLFQCPVCGSNRVYNYYDGWLKELEPEFVEHF